jgi:hypothetical protein
VRIISESAGGTCHVCSLARHTLTWIMPVISVFKLRYWQVRLVYLSLGLNFLQVPSIATRNRRASTYETVHEAIDVTSLRRNALTGF